MTDNNQQTTIIPQPTEILVEALMGRFDISRDNAKSMALSILLSLSEFYIVLPNVKTMHIRGEQLWQPTASTPLKPLPKRSFADFMSDAEYQRLLDTADKFLQEYKNTQRDSVTYCPYCNHDLILDELDSDKIRDLSMVITNEAIDMYDGGYDIVTHIYDAIYWIIQQYLAELPCCPNCRRKHK